MLLLDFDGLIATQDELKRHYRADDRTTLTKRPNCAGLIWN
jgi:hypothetical protein